MGEEYLIETMANRRQIWKYEKNMNHILLTAITILFASQLSFGEPVSLNRLQSFRKSSLNAGRPAAMTADRLFPAMRHGFIITIGLTLNAAKRLKTDASGS